MIIKGKGSLASCLIFGLIFLAVIIACELILSVLIDGYYRVHYYYFVDVLYGEVLFITFFKSVYNQFEIFEICSFFLKFLLFLASVGYCYFFIINTSSTKLTESRFATLKDLKKDNLIYKGNGIVLGIFDCKIVVELFVYLSKLKMFKEEKKAGKDVSKKLKKSKRILAKFSNVISKAIKSRIIKTFEPLSTIVFSPPGTGKTAGVVMPTMVYHRESIIVFDPKGEVYSNTHKFREKLGKVIRLNLTRANSDKYNPLSHLALIGIEADIQSKGGELPNKCIAVDNIALILIPDKQGDYFSTAGRNLLRATMKVAIIFNSNENIEGGGTTFNEVGYSLRNKFIKELEIIEAHRKEFENTDDAISMTYVKESFNPDGDLAGNVGFYSYLVHELKRKIAECKNLSSDTLSVLDDLKTDLIGFSTTAEEEASGIFNTMMTALSLYSNPIVKANTSDNDVVFEELFSGASDGNSDEKKPVTIYITCPLEDIKTISPVINMFFENMVNYFLSRIPKDSDYRPVIIIDEFPQLGKMRAVFKSPAVSRGQKFSTIFIAQDPNQINEIYGQEASKELCNTCSFIITFTQNDFAAAKVISDLTGSQKVKEVSFSYDKYGNKSSSNESWSEKPVITANDIQSLRLGEGILIRQFHGNLPVKINILPWFMDEAIVNAFKKAA